MILTNFLQILKDVTIADVCDIALMSTLTYAILTWFQKRRAAFVVGGIIICGVIYLLAHQFNLMLTTTILQSFFTVTLVAILIIFQEELRSFFEQIAVWSFNRKFKNLSLAHYPKTVDVLLKTLPDLIKERIGALIVIKGKEHIDRFLQGGVNLNGDVSEALLKSIFDPHSVGHDGAVFIDGDRVLQFGCHLPLSKDFRKLTRAGTRHAAALGLAEVCDALCIVVSEETGIVSIAQNGEMKELGEVGQLGNLRSVLEKFFDIILPLKKNHFWLSLFTKNYKIKFVSILLTIAFWFVVVHESSIIHKTFSIPIKYAEPSDQFYVESIEPKEVKLTFSGPRHTFNFMNPSDIRAILKLYNYRDGQWSISLSDANINFPRDIILEDIEPDFVMVEIEKK